MKEYENDKLRSLVRDSYKALIVGEEEGQDCCEDESVDCCEEEASCCQPEPEEEEETCCEEVSCCSGPVFGETDSIENISISVGYSQEEIGSVPEKSNFGLGCGNPVAEAEIRGGEDILDLGSGAGFDSFLAANKLKDRGQVIGVDMTPEMVSLARENASQGGYKNVSFRLGEIEYLPIESSSIDLVISNCVINLSPDQTRVYREAYRVLREGGRLCISDMINVQDLSDEIVENKDMYCGCITGALGEEELRKILEEVGFQDISINPQPISAEFEKRWGQDTSVGNYVMSAIIRARK